MIRLLARVPAWIGWSLIAGGLAVQAVCVVVVLS